MLCQGIAFTCAVFCKLAQGSIPPLLLLKGQAAWAPWACTQAMLPFLPPWASPTHIIANALSAPACTSDMVAYVYLLALSRSER